MCGAPAMIFSASASASANGCVSISRHLVSIELCDHLEAGQIVKGHHRLVGAHVAGVRDSPAAVRAPFVPVVIERRARDHDAELGRDHRVLERPDAGGGVTVHGDLRLPGRVCGEDSRPELGAEERDDLVPAAHLQGLAVGLRAVVDGGVFGERVADLVPQLGVHAAQVAVLHLPDVFDGPEFFDWVHGHKLAASGSLKQEPVLVSGQGGTVRFSYAESMTEPSFYAPLARAAEEAGYDSMVVPDSICYPRHADSRYPFSPDGSREFLEDKPFLEPFSLIPALGAVTSRLRFVTFVLKLPVRDPVLVAKQATSTAVLTGGRLVLGVGVSPWREDYEVLGVDWASRGQRMDESVAILRGLASGDYFEYHGKAFDLPPVKIAPVPPDPIPVLIGGHSDAALRRAARLGDGWLHGGGDPKDLPGLLAKLAGYRRAEGADSRPFDVQVISMDAYTLDGVRRLEDQGVTDVIVGFRWPYVVGPDPEPLADKLTKLRRFADTVIARQSA